MAQTVGMLMGMLTTSPPGASADDAPEAAPVADEAPARAEVSDGREPGLADPPAAASSSSSSAMSSLSPSSTLSCLLRMFSWEDDALENPPTTLEGLRSLVGRAGQAGAPEEALDTLRARLEELEAEAQRELTVRVCRAGSGAVVAVVRARPTETLVRLREAVLHETGEFVAVKFLSGLRTLSMQATLEEAGINDGDSVQMVCSQLCCLTASFDGTARLHSLSPSGEVAEAMVARRTGPVFSASLAPGGAAMLTVSSGGDAKVWRTDSGEQLCELQGKANSGEFSPDGQLVVGACCLNVARIWCSSTGTCQRELRGHTEDVKAASFSPDGRLVATASRDKTAVIWDASTGLPLVTLEGHGDAVKAASFSQDGKLLVTASMDATARTWEVETGRCLRVLRGHAKALSCAAFSSAGDCLLTASFDGSVRIWDVADGACFLTLPADNNVVNSAAFSPDGRRVLVASASEQVRIFSAESGECILTLKHGDEDWVRSAAFSPDGQLVSSASYDGTAKVWSAVTGECLRTIRGHRDVVILASIECM